MSTLELRLESLGIALPAPLQLPPGAVLPFPWVRVFGRRAIVSGTARRTPTDPRTAPRIPTRRGLTHKRVVEDAAEALTTEARIAVRRGRSAVAALLALRREFVAAVAAARTHATRLVMPRSFGGPFDTSGRPSRAVDLSR